MTQVAEATEKLKSLSLRNSALFVLFVVVVSSIAGKYDTLYSNMISRGTEVAGPRQGYRP